MNFCSDDLNRLLRGDLFNQLEQPQKDFIVSLCSHLVMNGSLIVRVQTLEHIRTMDPYTMRQLIINYDSYAEEPDDDTRNDVVSFMIISYLNRLSNGYWVDNTLESFVHNFAKAW